MVQLEVLASSILRGTEEQHETLVQDGISWLEFKLLTFRTRVKEVAGLPAGLEEVTKTGNNFVRINGAWFRFGVF
jgi:hypothetical protein